MSSLDLLNQQLQQRSEKRSEKDSDRFPSTFAEAIANVKAFALQEFDREIAHKQLCYHTREHVDGVQRRASLIFQTICPYWTASLEDSIASDDMTRMELLDLCVTAHDMVQIFIPHQPHTSRQREAGVSETATIKKLFDYIEGLNQQLHDRDANSSALFTDADLQIVREAIEATICTYAPSEQAIYQPALYNSNKHLSPIAQILALADIGTLGIEGIAAYSQEGSLLFLEENPDVIPLMESIVKEHLVSHLELYENIRQRLLKRARFQVNFAKSRLTRCSHELVGLPEAAIPVLVRETFQYLNQDTIREIESTTPTSEDTPLEALVEFFRLDQYI